MDKLKAFLIIDGVIIGLAFLAFFYFYNRKNRESFFRDDLWNREENTLWSFRPRKKMKTLNHADEEKIDKKILLEGPHEQQPKYNFKIPNFLGAPHEILGVSAHASEEEINLAFRHWIKRYHPDRVSHLGKQYIDQARRRAEQLNSARAALMKKKEK